MCSKRIVGALLTVLVPMLCVVAGGVTPAAAQINDTGPFAGNLQESFESFPNYVDSPGFLGNPTTIMGGGATISNGSMIVYEPAASWPCNPPCFGLVDSGAAKVADGTKGLAVNGADETATITFQKAVTQVGGYWAVATIGFAAGVQVEFFDEGNNAIGSPVSFQYDHMASPDGALDWHGWASTTPIKTMVVTGSFFAVDSLQATAPSSSTLEVTLDIEPGSCKNVLHLRNHRRFFAVIRGSQDLDVSKIDPSSLRLAGVAPIRTSIHDTFAVVSDPDPGDDRRCDCVVTPRDGVPDLVMKFRTSSIVDALQQDLGRPLKRGETLTLTLEGALLDGTPITGQDVVIVKR